MRRVFLFLIVAALWLQAAPPPSANVELLAARVDRNGTKVTAEGDVVVYYDGMVLQADRVVYDTNRSLMDLYGNVTLIRSTQYALLSDHVHLELSEEKGDFDRYFLTGFETGLWARGEKARKRGDLLLLEKAIVSSCDVACPDWHIGFSSVDYNETTRWMNIWNPRFYIKDTPVFYLPYLGASMERRRKSGLLRPSFGISDRDGFIYEQPLYLAVDPQWDLEVTPQIRTDRGAGAYAEFRFVDTPYSEGAVKMGYFKTRSDYVDRYNLRNSSHYGIGLLYERRRLLTDGTTDHHDGLYVDATYLNDPDYINLQSTTRAELADSSQVQSRINYTYNTPYNYLGLYGKYFIDTALTVDQRRETFQNVPILQLHHYQASLAGIDALQFSADYRFNHFFTESGRHIQFQEINLPFTFYTSFFDDYLKLSVSENLYYSYSAYTNMEDVLESYGVEDRYYSLFRNFHTFDFYSDLARSYGEDFHTMQLRVTYNRPSFSSEKGSTVKEISVLRSPRENLMMSVISYLYDRDGSEYLYHRIAQPVLYEPPEEGDLVFHRYGDIENELRVKFFDHYEFYTDLFFSYYLHTVSTATTYAKYRHPDYDIMVTHFYKREETKGRTSDFFTLGGTYRSEGGTDWYGNISYDNLEKKMNRWGIGTHIFRHCWDLDIGIRDEIKPILSSAEKPDSIHNITFYFRISLVPFGTYEHAFEQEL